MIGVGLGGAVWGFLFAFLLFFLWVELALFDSS